jgi:Fe2+ transport system protein FeoA
MRKIAPMGDPMELSLRGYTLTMRREDAARVEVSI